jgi:hypothetical protein
MTDITDGFTSICAGTDSIENIAQGISTVPGSACASRSPTGARVTLEFRRETALAPAQLVRARYDFAGDGTFREGTGIAKPTQTVVRLGHAVVYHYRMSYWIAPAALMEFMPGNVRYRTENPGFAPQPSEQQTVVGG